MNMFEKKELKIKNSGQLEAPKEYITYLQKCLEKETNLKENNNEASIMEKIKTKIKNFKYPNFYEINYFKKILCLQLRKYGESKNKMLKLKESIKLIDYINEYSHHIS